MCWQPVDSGSYTLGVWRQGGVVRVLLTEECFVALQHASHVQARLYRIAQSAACSLFGSPKKTCQGPTHRGYFIL